MEEIKEISAITAMLPRCQYSSREENLANAIINIVVIDLGGFVKATSQSVADECGLEHFLDGGVDVHIGAGCCSRGGGGGRFISFHVRHDGRYLWLVLDDRTKTGEPVIKSLKIIA